MQHKKHSVLEVSAGAQPGEVIDAIMRSGGPAKEVPLSQRLFPALMKIGVSSRNRPRHAERRRRLELLLHAHWS